ncbi:MAG: hypothetical protein ABDH37_01475 [Candidatus Hydrothermales bacterium]
MQLIILFFALKKVFTDSTLLYIPFLPEDINIENVNGSIIFNYSQQIKTPVVFLKKSAKGEKEEFLEWVKKVEIIKKEDKEKKDLKIIIKFPEEEKFEKLEEKKVEIKVTLPEGIRLGKLKTSIVNGVILISNLYSEFYNVSCINGYINLKEIRGNGKFEIVNGSMEVFVSHNEEVNCNLEIVNGNAYLFINDFTKIDYKVKNGEIYEDTGYKEIGDKQYIKCDIINGFIKIKRKR